MERQPHEEQHPSTSRRRQLRLVAGGMAVVLLVWFALANSTSVTVDYFGYHSHSRVITVIAVSALLGAMGGFLLGWRGRQRSGGSRRR